MTTTLTQLTAKVIHKLGETADDGMLDSVTESINAGLQQMATEYDWPWLVQAGTISTIAGTQGYSLPGSCTRVRELFYDGDTLTVIQFAELVRYSDLSDVPACFYVQNSSIKLAPVPNGVYVLGIEYMVCENVLTSGSDTILCPDWYSDLVAVYGAIEEARRRRDTVLVNLLEQSKAEWIQRIRDNIQRTKNMPDILTRIDVL